jgi:hypothetical protein
VRHAVEHSNNLTNYKLMAENTDEEHLDNPTNTQSKTPSDEIIPINDTETISPNQETENMEVHHHPDLHHKPKKWKEYFLEFLMIFLAVSLGFFAESYRESLVNKEKEEDYIKSMVNNLKADIATTAATKKFLTGISRQIDTMLMSLKSENPDPSLINRMLSQNFWPYTGFAYNNQTIEQLKSSGNFRLIRNQSVVDSILNYDNNMRFILLEQYNDLKNTMYSSKDAEEKVIPYSELKRIDDKLFDTADFKNMAQHTFITQDKALIAFYYNKLFIHEKLCHTFMINLDYSQEQATSLINLIKKEYKLD